MTLRNFFTVTSVISFVFGLGFLFVTQQLVSLYGVTLNAGGVFVGQLYGAVLISFGVLDWSARLVSDSKGLQAVVLANLVALGLSFLIALSSQLTGVGGVNQLGWSTVVLFLLLTLGFAYFQFVKTSA